MLDEKRVREFIESNLDTIERSRNRFDLDLDKLSELDGAEQTLKIFRTMLNQGVFNADPTPLKEIKVRTQNIVRRNDPGTSWDAAIQQTSEKRQSLYTKIMAGLYDMGPATDEMLSDFVKTAWPEYKFSPSGLRTRRSELVKAGWIKADGKKTIRNGNQATVWVSLD